VKNIKQIQKLEGDGFSVQNDDELPSINTTGNLINDIHKSAIISEVKNNKDIQEGFIEQARKTVGNELFSINQENILRKQKTTYDANKEACRLYGIDGLVPLWQIQLMKFGTSFWFLIYWLFATLTIAPINIFFQGLKPFIKNNILVFVFSMICYLLIVLGVPLLISLF
jgi:hypothetical protein